MATDMPRTAVPSGLADLTTGTNALVPTVTSSPTTRRATETPIPTRLTPAPARPTPNPVPTRASASVRQATIPSHPVVPAIALAPPARAFPAAPGQVATSKNWSGYVARNGSYTAVRGTWTIPQVDPSVVVDVVTWVGIGGSTTADLIQAGTEAKTFSNFPPRYEAWFELLPGLMQPVPLVVQPGNSISVAITSKGGKEWLIAFTNNTTGQSYQASETYQSTFSSVEWVVERPSYDGQLQELAKFGAIEVTDALAERKGQPVSIAQAGAAPLNMIDPTGHVIATVSGLGGNGSSFKVTRTG